MKICPLRGPFQRTGLAMPRVRVGGGSHGRRLDDVVARQVAAFDAERMAAIGDERTARFPLVDDEAFLAPATRPEVLAICRRLLGDYVVLMQQNGVINPPVEADAGACLASRQPRAGAPGWVTMRRRRPPHWPGGRHDCTGVHVAWILVCCRCKRPGLRIRSDLLARKDGESGNPHDSASDWEDKPDAWYATQEFRLLLHRLRRLPAIERTRLQGRFTQLLLGETFTMDTPRGNLEFVLLGKTSGGRARGVLTKQPATIEWIDRFEPGGVFWDIGANVGTYTLYAGLRGDTRVVAFEPAAVNYFLLSANCEINQLDERVNCLLVGLGGGKALGRLEVSQFASGHSFTFRGAGDEYRSHQAALLLSIDELVEEFGVPCPTYLKIDVRALTEEIIAGGARTLSRPEVREVHMELRAEAKAGRRIVETLRAYGLTLAGEHVHGGTTDATFVRSPAEARPG